MIDSDHNIYRAELTVTWTGQTETVITEFTTTSERAQITTAAKQARSVTPQGIIHSED